MGYIEGQNKDGSYGPYRRDKSGALRTADVAHSKAHDGLLWTHTFEFTNLAAAAAVNLCMAAAAGKRVHVEAFVSADAGGVGRVYKKPTYADGTPLAGVNVDFDIDTASPLTVVSGATISVAGTLAGSTTLASGVGNVGGGQSSSRHEFQLSPTGKAAVTFTAKTNGTNGSILLVIYEET